MFVKVGAIAKKAISGAMRAGFEVFRAFEFGR
jgi:hypothetical protein